MKYLQETGLYNSNRVAAATRFIMPNLGIINCYSSYTR